MFYEVFELFRICGGGHESGTHRDSSGAVRVASSAIEIKSAVSNDQAFNVLYCLPMAGLMVLGLRPLLGWNVSATRHDCCSRELQWQQREHQHDQKSAHPMNFKRLPFQWLRARAISSASSGRTGKGSKALTVERPGLPSGRRPLR